MRSSFSSPSRRWAVPAAVAVVVAGGALVVPQLANANPDLPPANAQQLLAQLAGSQTRPFSGTVVQTTDLGLPKLPQQSAGSGADLVNLLSGSTTVRVWSDGPTRSRLAVLGAYDEDDVVRDGRDVWTWDSKQRTAKHVVLPTEAQLRAAGVEDDAAAQHPVATGTTPDEAAKQAVAAVDPSTKVTLAKQAVKIAGRDAYQLVLTPRSGQTLVGRVVVALDSATKLPLRVQVFAHGATKAAYETGFTGLRYGRPGAEVFRFTAPARSKVSTTRVTAQQLAAAAKQHESAARRPAGSDRVGQPTVLGKDWTSVLVLKDVPPQVTQGADNQVAQSLLSGFRRVSGPYGSGKALQTSLLSALWLDDGTVLVGAVPTSVLEQDATQLAAKR